jgi:hypothetical protein
MPRIQAAWSELYPKPEQHAADVLLQVDLLEVVSRCRRQQDLAGRGAGSARAHPEPIQRRAEQVGGRVLDRLDRVPPLPQFQERVLHQLLRVLGVSRDEVQGPVQAVVHVEEHLSKSRGVTGGSRSACRSTERCFPCICHGCSGARIR